MTMNLEQFKKNLLVYGANVHEWPEEIKQAGLKAIETSSEFRALLAEEVRFEQVLKTRTYKEPNNDLAERIVLAAQPKKKRVWSRLVGLFQSWFGNSICPNRHCLLCLSHLFLSCYSDLQ